MSFSKVYERDLGEGIQVGSDIKIRVVRIKGQRVRLMIEAPSKDEVFRIGRLLSFDLSPKPQLSSDNED